MSNSDIKELSNKELDNFAKQWYTYVYQSVRNGTYITNNFTKWLRSKSKPIKTK